MLNLFLEYYKKHCCLLFNKKKTFFIYSKLESCVLKPHWRLDINSYSTFIPNIFSWDLEFFTGYYFSK